jgi:hypothetical protein
MIVPVNIVAVQVNQNNSLFVTTGVDYDNSGTLVGSEITAQYTLNPGDSLEGQPAEVVKIANALWTPSVVEAYKLANPPVVSLPLPWVPKPEELSSGDSPKTALKPLRLEQIVDPLNLPTSDVEPSVDGMSTKILG